MNAYEPSTPRAALSLAAAAMAAITIGAMVVLPTTLDSGNPGLFTVASAKATVLAPIEVAITPARIDVFAVREPNVTWAMGDSTRPCKPEG
jgi:hypothetical protein